jgi:DNA-binding NtrC family response regulator
MDGLALFRHIVRDTPGTAVILMTGYATIHDAVASVREGAHDYLTKPFESDTLIRPINRIAERLMVRRELEKARGDISSRPVDEMLIGFTPVMAKLAARLDVVAQSIASVVITGESGTGKELAAKTIHNRGPRRDGPFVAVNCGAFPETLLEAELFGHERGAFTGAAKKRDGRFKAADGGTLLLDEVGEISLAAQIRLLRVLQDRAIEPLGSNRAVPVDVRIIAATHRNLKELVAQGRFREDLFFRLNVLEVVVPPLRDRKSDIAPLLAHFLTLFTPKGQLPPGVTPAAWAALNDYSYPGNVREFAHAIERALVLSRGDEIAVEHLPIEIAGPRAADGSVDAPLRKLSAASGEFERDYLLRAVRMAPTRNRAAELLGISRKTLWEKLQKHGISGTKSDRKREPPEE